MTLLIPVKILENGVGLDLPSYATAGSAAMDLRAAIGGSLLLHRHERALVPAGIAIALPVGYCADIRSRSGLAHKNGITVLNSPGTVDSDYRGELKVLLVNFGDDFMIERGMRIAQLLISKYESVGWEEADSLEETSRSSGGYGSTGIR
ncbi:MAG: dUTP diphosphatase [Holosporaceae bacterium]|jgi:dUTP pyrophosphatase|nr:dUTP diphosphatase [Holosporaceae bacterium]